MEHEQMHVIQQDERTPASTDPADKVRALHDCHAYPAPVTDLDRYIELYRNADRHRAFAFLLWPTGRPRTDREILVAGCGTSLAARYALREPAAHVPAIDVSDARPRHTRNLQQKVGRRISWYMPLIVVPAST